MGGFIGDNLAAVISAVRYGDHFGFLGFYIVAPDYRGQGYGYRIWQHALRCLHGPNIGLVQARHTQIVLLSWAKYARKDPCSFDHIPGPAVTVGSRVYFGNEGVEVKAFFDNWPLNQDRHLVNTDHCARRTPACLPEGPQCPARQRALEIFTCRQSRHILGSQSWRQALLAR